MIILRGKDKGKEKEVSQWCNDWVTSKDGKVYSITNAQFTQDEFIAILSSDDNGNMFDEFEVQRNRTFKRKRK